MKKITVILPIHKLDDNYRAMMSRAIASVEPFHNDVKLSVIMPNELAHESIPTSEKLEIITHRHNKDTGFASQVNVGIENCDTEWFSVLEVDDEYKPVWLSAMNAYMNENPTVGVFLPIVKDINVEGKFLNYTNESTWAYGFTEKQGFLDNEILMEFQNYQTSGALFKTESVKEFGLLKDNIKLTFNYELLLRLTHNGVEIMTVPKIAYQHVNFREDSLFWSYKNDETLKLAENEATFWIESAKKEFFFKNKRDLNYVAE